MKSTIPLAILAIGLRGLPIVAQEFNDISLAQLYQRSELGRLILPRNEWQPFPTCSRPEGLEDIPLAIRQAQIHAAEVLLDAEWDHFPATVFLEYVRNGNRSNYEALSFGRRQNLVTLVLGELFERQGRFMEQIVNGIWAVCEESFWGVPAHNHGRGLPDVEQPIVDLFAAETGAMMAWIHYLLAPQLDNVNPLVTKRMLLETDKRILTPYLEHNDWGWMGFGWRNRIGYERPVNNWNPWINSNIITCALLLEKDEQRRLDIVHKCMDSLDNFLLPYPADGGCDEGPSYWGRAGASLYDCLELLFSASNGAIDVFHHPLIQNIGAFIYKAYISSPYFVNFADAPAKMSIDAPIVFRYGKAVGDSTMIKFAAFAAHEQELGRKALAGHFGALNRTLPALVILKELLATEPAEPLLGDVWLPDIQVMAARSQEGSADGFYLAAKGGHNDESHNHNDVGNFLVYYDGRPVLVDAGRQTYTAKTFSSRRYELWNNQSAYHNLPTINGVMQKEGHLFRAQDVRYKATNNKALFTLDIAGAYPEDAQIKSWQRQITLHRNKNIKISDSFSLNQVLQPVDFNFLTPLEPRVTKPGEIRLFDGFSKKSFTLQFNSSLSPVIEDIDVDDRSMSKSWGNRLYRIVLSTANDNLSGSYSFSIED
ncbi:heparinase [candidate division KSB1 bacterium]|nr:heparinase II/III family protein [candidate division KSB1 bacterium]RQW01805.1 MAG: heparinase [candidate division KSB1 bacterium]